MGKGSVFTIHLTLEKADTDRQTLHAPICIGKRALVVDDLDISRTILERGLERLGMQVLVAENAAQAVRILRSESLASRRMDLALFDDQMADGSGVELLRRIRQQPDLAYFPVILLSTIDKVKQNKENAAAGFASLLLKPARYDQLVNAISNALQEATGRRKRAATTPATQPDSQPLSDNDAGD